MAFPLSHFMKEEIVTNPLVSCCRVCLCPLTQLCLSSFGFLDYQDTCFCLVFFYFHVRLKLVSVGG